MDLELDDEQTALADSVRSVLGVAWPATALRSFVETGSGTSELWATLVGLDWPALCVGEEFGGLGYGPTEEMLVHEGCGRAAMSGAFFPTTALFAPVIDAVGSPAQRERWLPEIAAGTRTGTAAFLEMVRANTPVRARRGEGGWQLDGIVRSVIEAGAVDHVVVPARSDGGLILAVVPSADMDVAPIRSVDASRRIFTVVLDDVFVSDVDVLGGHPHPQSAVIDGVIDHAIVALAADLVGTCGAIVDLTLDHVKEREQFGVKIGSFQAIKHRLADAYVEVEAARASVRVASVALAEDDPRAGRMASSALALAGDAARTVTTEGIQMLGGIGFTWEHDVHLFVKRALSSSVLLGDAELHRQRVARGIGLVST